MEVKDSEVQGCKLTIDLIFCISPKVTQHIGKLGRVCFTDRKAFLYFSFCGVFFFCAK